MVSFKDWLIGFWLALLGFCKRHKVGTVLFITLLMVFALLFLASCQGLNVLEGIEGEVVVNSPVDII